jgi:hypothetical protein
MRRILPLLILLPLVGCMSLDELKRQPTPDSHGMPGCLHDDCSSYSGLAPRKPLISRDNSNIINVLAVNRHIPSR